MLHYLQINFKRQLCLPASSSYQADSSIGIRNEPIISSEFPLAPNNVSGPKKYLRTIPLPLNKGKIIILNYG